MVSYDLACCIILLWQGTTTALLFYPVVTCAIKTITCFRYLSLLHGSIQQRSNMYIVKETIELSL